MSSRSNQFRRAGPISIHTVWLRTRRHIQCWLTTVTRGMGEPDLKEQTHHSTDLLATVTDSLATDIFSRPLWRWNHSWADGHVRQEMSQGDRAGSRGGCKQWSEGRVPGETDFSQAPVLSRFLNVEPRIRREDACITPLRTIPAQCGPSQTHVPPDTSPKSSILNDHMIQRYPCLG